MPTRTALADGAPPDVGCGADATDDEPRRYREAVRYLYDLTPAAQPGVRRPFGTGRVRELLRQLGDPQDAVATVHVAGTAGKGSVCAFVAALLHAHGFRVGAHLSPHAYSILERFRIDGGPVAPASFVAEVDRVRAAVARGVRAGHGRPSFFEATNAVAFRLFASRVDYSVIETGIGGLHDSTNVIARRDKLAVLTSVGLDHTEVLGETLPEIAAQKAGIIAAGGQVISARNRPGVDSVIARHATRRGAGLEVVDTPGAVRTATLDGRTTVLHLPDGRRLPLGLAGRHQAGNAAVALRAVEALAVRDGWWIDEDAVREGLRHASLPGRLEYRTAFGRTVVADGAHNAMKLSSVAATLGELHPGRRPTWVVALRQGKRLDAALRAIAPNAGLVVATEFEADGGDHPVVRSRPAVEVAAAARAAGVRAVVDRDPVSALRRACAEGAADVPLVVSGSFSLLAGLEAATSPA